MGVSNPCGPNAGPACPPPSTNQIEAALNDFVTENDGIEPAIYSVWSQWGSRGGNQATCTPAQGSCYFPADTLQMLDDRGIQGMVWWEPIDPGNPLNGKYSRHKSTYVLHKNDDYIEEWAREAKLFGRQDPGNPNDDTKIVLRFAHEANGTWFPWTVGVKDNTAKTFKKYWRYVYNKFKAEGALPYVDFLWSVTNKSCNGCNPYAKIFPGNSFIDYAGITAFNWGKQRQWKSMRAILVKPMSQLSKVTHKPVIVAELASNYLPKKKSKATWIKNGYVKAYRGWGRIKAIMYLNSDQPKHEHNHPDWRLSKPGNGSAQAAYAAISKKYKFKGSLLD
jgi:hypothetical protein